MKLLKLQIKNLRGIPNLEIEPKGKSFVICGPNGSGKSAVIDSLDFLLTGKIARLSGEGTEGVSLKKHGPHIDKIADLINVLVKAEIQIPGIVESVSISRKMSQSDTLVYNTKYEIQLAPILELLNRGQYVFTRREILKLITAKSSTRAQEIQKVLKLSEIEEIRSTTIKIQNEIIKEEKTAKAALDKAKKDVIALTGHIQYNSKDVLKFINEQRVKLNGKQIEELNSQNIQDGIKGIQVNPKSINVNNLEERIINLKNAVNKNELTTILKADNDLRTEIKTIKEDVLAEWNIKRYQFTKKGIDLLRESGECPLCDTKWKEGELKKYLQSRIDNESDRQKILTDNCKIITDKANDIKIRIQQVMEKLTPVEGTEEVKKSEVFKNQTQKLQNWKHELTEFENALKQPMEQYKEERFDSEGVKSMYTPIGLTEGLSQLVEEVKTLFPEATPEQTAWDNLTKLVERIKVLEDNQTTLDNTVKLRKRAEDIAQTFVSARDEVLEDLYTKIKNRFVGLYKEIHGEDEKDFGANLKPQEAGLNLEVDFYGRGMHPPHALHSEGHQDSMGVCLFLALSEHLNSGLIDLVILDDVVMSVDAGHRKAFCAVLKKNFLRRQFIITTHDTTWANQLRWDGVVEPKQMLRFFNWNVDTGPMVHYEVDMWDKIEKDINNDDINSASAKLRRGLEEFSRYVCHNLHAAVPYTLGDAGSLGDFMPAAIGQYKKLIKQAKNAAQKWRKSGVFDNLYETQSIAEQIIKRTKAEEWTINTAVHYNEWENFTKNDFQPVFEAFRDLCNNVFTCPNTGCSLIKAVYDGPNIVGVKCNCGEINWNLKENI